MNGTCHLQHKIRANMGIAHSFLADQSLPPLPQLLVLRPRQVELPEAARRPLAPPRHRRLRPRRSPRPQPWFPLHLPQDGRLARLPLPPWLQSSDTACGQRTHQCAWQPQVHNTSYRHNRALSQKHVGDTRRMRRHALLAYPHRVRLSHGSAPAGRAVGLKDVLTGEAPGTGHKPKYGNVAM